MTGDDAPPAAGPVLDATVRDGVCRLRRPGTRWLSTGANGGESVADAAYNVTVPDGWPETDLAAYVRERRERAGLGGTDDAPALLTGVDQRHARRARFGPVDVVATAGVSNPAALPMSTGGPPPDGADGGSADHAPPGTVNVVAATTRALPAGTLANLVAVVAEAKAATLLDAADVPGTTTDAVVVGCDPSGERAAFSGSATEVGNAARVCVRDAVRTALRARYGGDGPPASVADAEHGLVAEGTATVSRI